MRRRLISVVRQSRRAFVVALAVLLASSCRTAPSAASPREYALNGVVLEVDAAGSRLTVGHDAIAGLMPAMAMPFQVKPMPASVSVGDRIAGTLVVTADASWLERVTVTPHAPSATSPVQTAGARAMLAPGSIVPDVSLINQDGRHIRLADYRGQLVVLTFIYTRCPLPNYCPLTMRHLEAARSALGSIGSRVRFVGVSFDPAHDTPDVLNAYGREFIRDPTPFAEWDLVTADAASIADLAGAFGVIYAEQDGAITHSLATALVDGDRRVVQIWRDNTWRPEDIVTRVRQLTTASATGD